MTRKSIMKYFSLLKWQMLISQNLNAQRFNLHLFENLFGGLKSSTLRANVGVGVGSRLLVTHKQFIWLLSKFITRLFILWKWCTWARSTPQTGAYIRAARFIVLRSLRSLILNNSAVFASNGQRCCIEPSFQNIFRIKQNKSLKIVETYLKMNPFHLKWKWKNRRKIQVPDWIY